jgi:hypothetical protein
MINDKSPALWSASYRSPAVCLLLTAVCRLLLLQLFLFLPSVQAQEVIDKMVATVNGGVRTDLITYSDLLWQLALEPGTPLDSPDAAALNRASHLLIDQKLILQEAEKLPTISPAPKEVENARNELVKLFPSASEMQTRMLKVGLTSRKLDEILEQRIKIEKYLDFRFRNFVVITEKEITDYYNQVFVPRFRRQFPGRVVPKLEEAHDQISARLTEDKVESDIDNFLDTARERAEIVMLSSI